MLWCGDGAVAVGGRGGGCGCLFVRLLFAFVGLLFVCLLFVVFCVCLVYLFFLFVCCVACLFVRLFGWFVC